MDEKEVDEEIDEPMDDVDEHEDQKSTKEPYLICVDPDRKAFYRMNLDTYKVAYEYVADEKLSKKFKKRMDKGLKTIKRIGGLLITTNF